MVITALVALALFLVSNSVAAESRFLFDSTGHSATILEPSSHGPAVYFDNGGNIGTIQRPLPKGLIVPEFQNVPRPATESESGITRRLPHLSGVPLVPRQPMEPMPSMTPYGMQP
jgi:hypothetical protein